MELTPTSMIAWFETNKAQRQDFALRVIDALDSVDPLKLHLQIKCMEDIVKLLNSNDTYKKAVLEAAEKHGQKTFQFGEAKFEIKEVGVKYDFSQCEDAGLQEMYKNQETLNDAIKKRETLLKSVPAKGMTITDEDSGETYTVYPPSKSSTTSVAVTLK